MAAARRCAPIRELLSHPLASSVGLHPNPTLTHPHLFSLATRAPTLTLTQARTTSTPLPAPPPPLSPRAPNLSSRLTQAGGRR